MRVILWRLARKFQSPSRRILMVICLALFIWCVTLLNVSVPGHGSKESDLLKFEIIKLSEKYVRALAKENDDIVDGPYAGRFTAYDLKKTIAVLLESILERLNKLEKTVDNVVNGTLNNVTSSNNISRTESLKVQGALKAEDLIQGKINDCVLSDEDKRLYPHCSGKIEWMKLMWKSDPCYQAYGVDGSTCSYIMYLSEVEGWCPTKAWRGSHKMPLEDKSERRYANATTDIDGLMKLLVDPNDRQSYAWIRMRIGRLWSRWSDATTSLSQKQDLSGRRKKKILVHLGLLSKQSGWKFAELQFKGGPLGELVQWSDLICTLYSLGHDLTVTSEVEQLAEILNKLPAASSPCQSRKELPVHIIYTDIIGLRQFKKHVKGGYGKFSCLLRIVDSFGTEPAFNLRSYAKQKKLLTSWGGQDLQTQQFFTMFPHSPDNSFMGFVVEQHLNDSRVKHIIRKNQAVVYGKNEYMWQAKEPYLNTVRQFLEIHGTVYTEKSDPKDNPGSVIPAWVKNHGILNGEELHTLLRESKVFLGLGFPYEGPAPLEAIANGAVFLNPKFEPPHSSKNNPFFKGKPTARSLSSQHPYAEQFIGEPYVYTVNISDLTAVKTTLQTIMDRNMFDPYQPYEFTEEGMMQRMNAYIEHQNFCPFEKRPPKWPSESAMQYLYGIPGQSCKEVCWGQNLICEPSHFAELNSHTSLQQVVTSCAEEKSIADIYYPAFDTKTNSCILQQEEMLYSCVGGAQNIRRLCPCRNYIRGQTALCKGCER